MAPIGVYTSGKGSSAAGLTASVVRDSGSVSYQTLDHSLSHTNKQNTYHNSPLLFLLLMYVVIIVVCFYSFLLLSFVGVCCSYSCCLLLFLFLLLFGAYCC